MVGSTPLNGADEGGLGAPEKAPAKVNPFIERQLDRLSQEIGAKLTADVLGMVGPILRGYDDAVRQALETYSAKRDDHSQSVAVVLDTQGGIIEVVERIAKTIRHHYDKVIIVVPNEAMSAGTVLAMAGDDIMMDYFSCLGPIDPQIEVKGALVPARSYLVQFERLKERSQKGELTTPELILLQKLDLAELHTFEEACELSKTLLREWLANYKFKDWETTETQRKPVTREMRAKRAEEIADSLMDNEKWHSHARPISMEVLRNDINLRIVDFGEDADLRQCIRDYFQFVTDYMGKIGISGVVHAQGICVKLY